MALNREYTVAEYLTTVTDPNLRKALTMYRLSEHSLAIEKGREVDTYFPQITQNHKELENKSNSHIYWVKYHSVTSQQLDL